MMPTKTLLLTAPGVDPVLHALDKKTGRRLAAVKLPAPGQYGMMGYLHRGRQYVVVQVGSPTHQDRSWRCDCPNKNAEPPGYNPRTIAPAYELLGSVRTKSSRPLAPAAWARSTARQIPN